MIDSETLPARDKMVLQRIVRTTLPAGLPCRLDLISRLYLTYQHDSRYPIDDFSCHSSESNVAADSILTQLDRDIVQIWRIRGPRLRRADVECNWRADSAIVRSYRLLDSL